MLISVTETADGRPTPVLQTITITCREDAESNACARMQHLGFPDAQLSETGDGCCVVAENALAHVTHRKARMGRRPLQALIEAGDGNQQLMMFTGAGYTPDATAFADKKDVALFFYEPDGTTRPVNTVAKAVTAAAAPAAPELPAVTVGGVTLSGRSRVGEAVAVLLLVSGFIAAAGGTWWGSAALGVAAVIAFIALVVTVRR